MITAVGDKPVDSREAFSTYTATAAPGQPRAADGRAAAVRRRRHRPPGRLPTNLGLRILADVAGLHVRRTAANSSSTSHPRLARRPHRHHPGRRDRRRRRRPGTSVKRSTTRWRRRSNTRLHPRRRPRRHDLRADLPDGDVSKRACRPRERGCDRVHSLPDRVHSLPDRVNSLPDAR